MKYLFKLFGVIFIVSSAFVSANEASLYAPQVQADEALVRVLNLTNNTVNLSVKPINKRIYNTASFRFSDYIRAKAGQLTLVVNQQKITLNAKAGNRYTLALKPDGSLQLTTDQVISKKGKSMLALYNFSTSKTLTLKTTNGKTSIIADIAPDHLGFREINAMALNMAIFNGSIKLRETNQQQLHKDRVTNIAIIDSEQGIAIAIMLSNTNTRI